MKKTFRIITFVAVVLIVACVLFACVPADYNNAVDKMSNAGYSVGAINTTADGSFVGNIANAFANAVAYPGMEAGLSAKKDNESVTAYWFDTTDHAKDCYNDIKENDSSVKRSGKVVYFGTAQGMKDFAK